LDNAASKDFSLLNMFLQAVKMKQSFIPQGIETENRNKQPALTSADSSKVIFSEISDNDFFSPQNNL